MRLADGLRYGLWVAVAATALRNRREYGVPTAWLTHIVGNTVTLLLPEWVQLLHQSQSLQTSEAARPLLRTLDRRVRDDPRYALYAAPLALGFIASHPSYSIYHGKWAERQIAGFGVDSIPHVLAAYALARLASETLTTLDAEMPPEHSLAPLTRWTARYADVLAAAVVALVTLVWEVSEYRAHYAELRATGRPPHEINMQWSWPDAITDSISNLVGLLAAVAIHRRSADQTAASAAQSQPPQKGRETMHSTAFHTA